VNIAAALEHVPTLATCVGENVPNVGVGVGAGDTQAVGRSGKELGATPHEPNH
jgi:hypothetical protein